ncbi:MAG: hypothetical protein MJY95_02540 [Bacteroidaceae bacterium]|nr:hypothetical protein [Bacteroidaceae bacterium]
MKKILAVLVSAIIAVSASAQSSTVYFTPVNDNVEIGLGFNPQTHKCIISIIEESKNEVDFNFDVINPFGINVMEKSFDEGNISVMPKTRKVNYYECQYELTFPELQFFIFNVEHNANININGNTLSGKDVAAALKSLIKF